MFDEVDEALRRMLRSTFVAEREVTVALDAPTKEWAARRNAPTVNLYLYDIREDLSRREAGLFDVVDDEGRVVARRPLARHFRLSYLVTAWTQRPEDEHRLLASALDRFLVSDALDPSSLTGQLAVWRKPIALEAGQPVEQRALSEIWASLGGQLKPSLDIVVTAPRPCGVGVPVGPPSTEPPKFTMNGEPSGLRPRPLSPSP